MPDPDRSTEPIELFHGSLSALSPGQVVSRLPGPMASGIDLVFDAKRSALVGLRQSAMYATKTAAAADLFMDYQCSRSLKVPTTGIRIYRVRMVPFHVGPMVLIGIAEQAARQCISTDPIVQEYWSPTKNWNFTEYLGSEIEILEEVARADHMVAHAGYQVDRMTAERLFLS